MKKLVCLSLVLLTLVYFASCGEKSLSPENAMQELASSVKFDLQTGTLSFTIPKETPDGYNFYIHVSGRVKMDDGGMSFHAFEEESENKNWESGKTYTHEIGKDSLLEGIVDIGLIEKDDTQVQYAKSIIIDENGTLEITSE